MPKSKAKPIRKKAIIVAKPPAVVDTSVIARALVGLPDAGDPQLGDAEIQNPSALLLGNQYREFLQARAVIPAGADLELLRRDLDVLTHRVAQLEAQRESTKPK